MIATLYGSDADARWIKLSGKTLILKTPGGTQVEYFARSGRAYLWRPGRTSTLKGYWKLVNQNQIRFRYGNHVQHVFIEGLTKMAKASCKGDPFKLSSGKIPYILKYNSSIAKLSKTCL